MNILEINSQKILALSYYSDNLPTEVIINQKKVFDHFNLSINQVCSNEGHGNLMTRMVLENLDNTDVFIFFDIDCIPLKRQCYDVILSRISDDEICGIEQQCNSNSSVSHIYAGPACLAFRSNTIKKYNIPINFVENHRSDVAQEFTYQCQEKNVKVNFLKLNDSRNYKWNLGSDRMFGNGSTFEGLVYHEYEIRNFQNIESFVNKCQEVIKV
jgi:hypothetical protein